MKQFGYTLTVQVLHGALMPVIPAIAKSYCLKSLSIQLGLQGTPGGVEPLAIITIRSEDPLPIKAIADDLRFMLAAKEISIEEYDVNRITTFGD